MKTVKWLARRDKMTKKKSRFEVGERVILNNPCCGWRENTILTVIDCYKVKPNYKILVADQFGREELVPTDFLRRYR